LLTKSPPFWLVFEGNFSHQNKQMVNTAMPLSS
jgi:hypothetical protein